MRDQAALEIRGRAAAVHSQDRPLSTIERCMAQLDRKRLQPLLKDIADLISPETKGQAASHAIF